MAEVILLKKMMIGAKPVKSPDHKYDHNRFAKSGARCHACDDTPYVADNKVTALSDHYKTEEPSHIDLIKRSRSLDALYQLLDNV